MIKGAWLHGVKETRVVKLFNKYYYGINVTQPNPGAFKLCCKERVRSRSGNHPKFGNTSKKRITLATPHVDVLFHLVFYVFLILCK